MATARLKPGRCNSWCYYAPVNGLPGKVCFYCGLPPEDAVSETKPLEFYDIEIDAMRAPTQADVDMWLEVVRAYSAMTITLATLLTTHRDKIKEIRSKHGLPA